MRRIESGRIRTALDNNALVLVSPIGYSPSGQAFNLNAEDLAAELAIAIRADKLIMFDDLPHVTDEHGERISTLTPGGLEQHFATLDDVKSLIWRCCDGDSRSGCRVDY